MTCGSQAVATDNAGQRSKWNAVFARASLPQVLVICSFLTSEERKRCLDRGAASILKSSQNQFVPRNLTQIRQISTAFMQDHGFSRYIQAQLRQDPLTESFQIRTAIWNFYGVLVVGNWKIADLRLLQKGYSRLYTAVVNAIGEDRVMELAHIWGRGGTIQFDGKKTLPGQFGLSTYDEPLTTKVVTRLGRFSSDEIAKRLAHEVGHANDKLLGYMHTGSSIPWSQEAARGIFSVCEVDKLPVPPPEDDRDSFFQCRRLNREIFRFFPTAYAATNASEFYGKMIDRWVHEKLRPRNDLPYACESAESFRLWREMETALIGHISQPDCPQ